MSSPFGHARPDRPSHTMGPYSVGPLSVQVSGLELVAAEARQGIVVAMAELPRAPDPGGGHVLDLEFVESLEAEDVPLVFDPVGPDPVGLQVVDTAGRAAALPLPDPTAGLVRVDRRLNPYVFRNWVWLPLVRLALERSGGCLVRVAAVTLDDRVIAIAAPIRTGKTRLLVELLGRGGRYLGDDWIALDAAGVAHPVESKLTLRQVHQEQLGRRARGDRRSLLRMVAAAARWTSSRLPALSGWLDRLATALWSLGFEAVPMSSVSSGGLARPGRITDIVVLCPASLPAPARDEVATLVAALGGLSSHASATIEAAYAALHPERPPGLFRPLADIAGMVAAATTDAAVHIVRAEGEWLEPTVLRLLDEQDRSG